MTLMGVTTMLTEGKTKTIEVLADGEVLVRSKDDITAGDGARRDVLQGRAAASIRTTSNIFRLLESRVLRTHLVDGVDGVTFPGRATSR